MSFAIEKTPCFSLTHKLVPVQYREHEIGLFSGLLLVMTVIFLSFVSGFLKKYTQNRRSDLKRLGYLL